MPEKSPSSSDDLRLRSQGQSFGTDDIARFRQRLGSLLRQSRRSIEPPVSQKDVADHLGIAQSAVSDWERGANWPSVLSLLSLLVFLDIDPNSLLEVIQANGHNGDDDEKAA